jgi:L-seryl-tRNA(Ser) seleniumtransferase
MTAEELRWADDELAPAIYLDRLTALTLEHLGGSAEFHDVAVFNRLTGATLATHLTLVRPGDVVVGVSASHSHPTVIRAAAQAGARFVDTVGAEAFARALEREAGVTLVVLTRLAVTYELMSLDAIRTVVKLAHDKGARVYVDDAGGARVAPAAFEHPRMLELGVDVGATGLDKYGTIGPRFGLMAGDKTLVGRIRAKGFECGLEARPMLYAAVVRTLEQYRPERVRELIATTRRVADALRPIFGPRLHETPTTAQLLADDLLALAMERGGVTTPPVVPYEAAAAFCMILLEEHRMLTVHFVGMPPGTADILFKFVRPETLERFGGPQKFAQAVDGAVTRLGSLLREPERLTSLLFGAPSTGSRSAPPPPRPSS